MFLVADEQGSTLSPNSAITFVSLKSMTYQAHTH